MNPATAYAACEAITRREAKNFAYGIRLLRRPERQALSAIYALARRVDDIGDGPGSADERMACLEAVREEVGNLGDGSRYRGEDPVLVALDETARRYPVPMGAFGELIDGCEADVRGATVDDLADLTVYCRNVAGSIGRLTLGVFGTTDPARAPILADTLGLALQLTNILRDVVEDRTMGRVYLPAEDARALGLPPDLEAPASEVARLVAYECPRARAWFGEGLELLTLLDRRSRACVGAMAGIYRRLLDRIEADPVAVTRERVSLAPWEKGRVAAAALAGRAL